MSGVREAEFKDWLTLGRLPFSSVAVIPFLAGAVIAARTGHADWLPASLGALAVLLITVTCHYFGEVYDVREDLMTLETGRSKFAGGTLLVATGILEPRKVIRVALVLLLLSAALGVTVTLLVGNLLLFGLGAFGAAAAVLYSTPPLRLAKRGVGELFIGFCYGWLTVATGFACARGQLPEHSLFLALPIGLAVFNIILINEFPDYEPDKAAGKRNIVVRLGKAAASRIYVAAAIGIAVTLVLLWHQFRSSSPLYLIAIAPGVLLSLLLAVKVAKGAWKSPATLEPVCGMTILLNHLCSVAVAITAS